MVFEQKKIQSETLGEYLQEVRRGLALSAEDVAEQVKIKVSYFNALEKGDFKQLPPDVYVLGFLKNLAEFYAVDCSLLLAQYKKEKTIQNQISQCAASERGWAKRSLRSVVVTPKLASIVAGLVFIAVTLGYIIWQVGSINRVPTLEIFEPQDQQVISNSYVTVRGKTDPGMDVAVNGQDVFVDNNGGFSVQLGMEAGPQEIAVVVSNKFGKTAEKNLNLIGQPQITDTAGQVQLTLRFSGDGTLTYAIDDSAGQSLNFHNGDTKVLQGQDRIVISTTNAGATSVTFNGQELGALGREGEHLSNIPFLAGSAPVNSTSSAAQ